MDRKREVTSEVAQGYKSRIEKYGERLFTFLDYDGVPWNNNNAENAIKLVASRRRLFGTSVSEAGLKDYLVFLSIYQTLRRKGISHVEVFALRREPTWRSSWRRIGGDDDKSQKERHPLLEFRQSQGGEQGVVGRSTAD